MEAYSRQGGERIMARAWGKRKQANDPTTASFPSMQKAPSLLAGLLLAACG